MKKLILGLFIWGLTTPIFAQVVEGGTLGEVDLTAVNYKYLAAAGTKNAALPVGYLQKHIAEYDVKESEFYTDDYDSYKVTFFIPDGQAVAAYDKNGNILRTIEKYKDVTLPRPVLESVAKQYPKWSIYKDVYGITYHQDKGAKKTYKLTLLNKDKKIKVKMDENGNFL
ncbi:MAG: nicotinate-nucleotide adenylyltransferase [Flavobacteriaceae bacterium]|nr:nicotinate-nucleotide adenylyltransferase [Flavobacteriaceae bacterium]